MVSKPLPGNQFSVESEQACDMLGESERAVSNVECEVRKWTCNECHDRENG